MGEVYERLEKVIYKVKLDKNLKKNYEIGSNQ
jgi:hypothetical protein